MGRFKIMAWVLSMGLVVAACSKDPTRSAVEAMKSGDLAKAESILDGMAEKNPGRKDVRTLRFVLYRHLSVHGSPDKQQAYLNKAIGEYDMLASALGLKPEYGDMEASLRTNPEEAALVSAARKPIYGE